MTTRAAQYLRTSTTIQAHSFEMQQTAIRRYATEKGFEIVRTYIDAGRSGLTLKNRVGLSQLLEDVISNKADYQAVLVYDVSRWGRFQDTDESAHYEFLCKTAKIPVHYCAETFADETGMEGAVLKTLKRAMAGEYSREQSRKSFRGQKRLVELGFRVGASAGYGLRRMLISADGKRRTILRAGQYKTLSTDRVVLVPGPKNEVACVRRIYEMAFLLVSPARIARELESQGIPYRNGKSWPSCIVKDILSNPKYAGWHVWNRTSKSLAAGCTTHPIQKWIIKPDAFQPLVDCRTFVQVQQLLHPFQPPMTDEALLSTMKALLAKYGKLTLPLMQAKSPGLGDRCYRQFGGLRYAYQELRYEGAAKPVVSFLRRFVLRDQVINIVREIFSDRISVSYQYADPRPKLRMDTGIVIGLRICHRFVTKPKVSQWHVHFGVREPEDQLLLCLMNKANDAIESSYLVPQSRLRSCNRSFQANDPLFVTWVRLDNLAQLYDSAAALDHTMQSLRENQSRQGERS